LFQVGDIQIPVLTKTPRPQPSKGWPTAISSIAAFISRGRSGKRKGLASQSSSMNSLNVCYR
jgi:hypothetical protein